MYFWDVPLENVLSPFSFRSKAIVAFRLDDDLDPEERIIALNPSTYHRALYWAINLYKIKAISYDYPTVLYCKNLEEVNTINDAFKGAGYYVPAKEANTRRRIELLLDSKSSDRIVILPYTEIAESTQWLFDHKANIVIDSFAFEEQVMFKEKHILTSNNEENVTIKRDNENIELDSDLYYKLISYYKPFRSMEQIVAKNSPTANLYILDERLSDYPSIRQKYGLRETKVEEINDLESFNNELRLFENYFTRNNHKNDLNIEQAISEIESIFIDGSKLREDQNVFIRRILPSKEDVVITLPTGGGKSILFEGPALYRGAMFGRLTIIVSPLKALMQDHFEKLTRLGFFTSIDFINHDKGLEIQDIYRRMAGGELLFLYITPERFKSKGFISALHQRIRIDKRLEYVVYDEAHCISQWGNEFRPDYYRSVIYIKRLRSEVEETFPVLLFSATVTNQVFASLKEHFPNVVRLEKYAHTNPIRDHIAMTFPEFGYQRHTEYSNVNINYIDELIKDLKEELDLTASRVLVFILSRKGTENYSEVFNAEEGNPILSSYYHAGLNSEARKSTYENFKAGKIHVLFATKAFGMGMDIPNIHHVYHFGPSTNFEDFLQEIGRAGRKEEARKAAGFIGERKIKTKCFLTEEDFSYLREMIQKNQVSWDQIMRVDSIMGEYMASNGIESPNEEEPVPIPLDLLNTSEFFKNERDIAGIFNIASFWLEKAGRYRQRYFVPGTLSFSNNYSDENDVSGDEQKSIIQLLAKKKGSNSIITLAITDIYPILNKKSLSRVFEIVCTMHRNKDLELIKEISFSSFKSIFKEERVLFNNGGSQKSIYGLNGVKTFILDILKNIPLNDRKVFSQLDLEDIAKTVFEQEFNIEHFSSLWIHENSERQDKRKQAYYDKNARDFLKRSKIGFYIINSLGGLKAEYKIDKLEKRVHTIIYKNVKDEHIEKELSELMLDCNKMITKVSSLIQNNTSAIDLVSFIDDLDLSYTSLYRINFVFAICKKLGYFKIDNSIIPFSMETFLMAIKSLKEINLEGNNAILEEYESTFRLRKLRLMVLESIKRISQSLHGEYIEAYFKCSSEIDIINLISEYDDASDLSQFREVALKEAYDELNPDQKAIFDFPLDMNLNVIAGPGTGKTHTLVTRVAMLIQKKMIAPNEILLLAYNRSVVEELRSRIRQIFTKLGYKSITRDLKIHTFASLERFALRDRLQEAEQITPRVDRDNNLDIFKTREAFFLHLLKTEPGYIATSLGKPRFIFVDEFQDITSNRLQILKGVFTPNYSSITVIGDPVQSIYGFEREGNIDPKPYYEEFDKLFTPEILPLSRNYRSTSEIVDYGQTLLADQNKTFEMPSLTANAGSVENSCEIINLLGEGPHRSQESIVSSFIDDGDKKELAILFRTNGELFRAYSKLRAQGVLAEMIHIQSSNDNFVRSREVSHFVDKIKIYQTEHVSHSGIDMIVSEIDEAIINKSIWEKHVLQKLIGVLKEYQEIHKKEDTYLELIDFIEDISRKDDGVLWKLYLKFFSAENNKRIVLSTMHKAKGLEFDEVIVTPSFHKLNSQSPEEFEAMCQEEERLLYVAVTRAKYKLYHYKWKREEHLFNRAPYNINISGLFLSPDIKNLFINTFGEEKNQRYIMNYLRIGDPVYFSRGPNSRSMKVNGVSLGLTSNDIKDEMNNLGGHNTIIDYYITGTFKYYCEEMKAADILNGKTFYDTLDVYSKKQGFVLLPVFAGYGKPKTTT